MAGRGILDQVRESLDSLRERLLNFVSKQTDKLKAMQQFAQENNVAIITAVQEKKESPMDPTVVETVPSYEEIQQMIREAAYFKWEAAGCPEGEQDRFWKEAEQELFGDTSDGYRFYVREGDAWIIRSVAA